MSKGTTIGKNCRRCRNHGLLMPWKGHKYNCPFLRCICEACILVAKSNKSALANLAQRRRLLILAAGNNKSKQPDRPTPHENEELVERRYSTVRSAQCPPTSVQRHYCASQAISQVCWQPPFTVAPAFNIKCSCLQRTLHLVAQRHLINEMLANRQKEIQVLHGQIGNLCTSSSLNAKDKGARLIWQHPGIL